MGQGMEYRPIPFTDRYEVGSDGHIYSNRRRLRPWGGGKTTHLRLVLRVGLQSVRLLVHRIVATVFHGQAPFREAEVRHLDGDPTNNDPSNLAWGTHSENMQDMIGHGRTVSRPEVACRMPRGARHGSQTKPERTPRGERQGRAKLDNARIREIRNALKRGETKSGIARSYGVSRRVIGNIASGKSWAHVEGTGNE